MPNSDEPPSTQAVLKAFDFDATDGEPYLSIPGLQSALLEHFDVAASREGVTDRVSEMVHNGSVVTRKRRGDWVYRATVGPELAADVKAQLEERVDEPRETYRPLDSMESPE